MAFAQKLITWYLENKRQLPWRMTKDPYQVWLSEIVLQQTRVEQGKPYYYKFLENFPQVQDLANASEEEVLKLWQGLGYYSRARNLLHTARYVSSELGGIFPASYKELIRLKGVGDYTASAIASVCYDEPAAAVDGNVYRMLSRIFGISTPTNTTAGIKEFKNLAQQLIPSDDPGNFNQAVIEFGSERCKPRQPLCSGCIFADRCIAFREQRIHELPVKLKNHKVRKRHFNYIVCISEENQTILQKRTGKDIWQGLYQFPLLETDSEVMEPENLAFHECLSDISPAGVRKPALFNKAPIIHKLTHQQIYTKFWILDCGSLPEKGIAFEELNKFPVPVLIEKFINTFDF